jgi:hypothetical protein
MSNTQGSGSFSSFSFVLFLSNDKWIICVTLHRFTVEALPNSRARSISDNGGNAALPQNSNRNNPFEYFPLIFSLTRAA